MTDRTGAFWSAQDAEVNAREGGSYVWTEAQVRETLADAALADLAVKMYGLSDGPNFRDPHDDSAEPANVLYLPLPLASLSAETGVAMTTLMDKRKSINQSLKAARDKRDQPITDDKVLTSWNGMMIAALADAGRVLEEPAYTAAAERAADAIVSHMAAGDGGLYHTMRNGEAKVPGFLEDYAWFVHGLIALNRARPDQSKWLELATHYTRAATDRFALDSGGYYDTLADQPDLFVRVRGTYDGAIPSANGRMVHNLLDLYELTGESSWFDRAVRDLRSFSDPLERSGAGVVQMQGALLRAVEIAPDRFADQAPPPGSAMEVEPSAEPLAASIQPGTITFVDGVATFAVTLDIGAGYHINSHQPSEAMLIPTELTLVGADGYELVVQYPEPDMAEYAYADRPLSVFQGDVSFNATLRRKPAATGPLPDDAALLLSYQACTDTACLSPTTVRLPLSVVAD
jgi:uncharacterized protein YyaL (SSP411 family)